MSATRSGCVRSISTTSRLSGTTQGTSPRRAARCWWATPRRGGGGLTDTDRATLGAAANVTLVTIPGSVFLLPDEAPEQTAAAIAAALSRVT